MKEISNSTLALLVVVAIVVSVAGTLVSLSKLGQIGDTGLTGMLSRNTTDVGIANLTVPSTTYINLTDDTIELGSIDIEKTNTSDIVDDWWQIRNDGSVNISVKIWDGSQDRTGLGADTAGTGPFESATTGQGCLSNTPVDCFQIKCNSTLSGYDCNNTYYAMPASEGSAGTFLVDLNASQGSDLAVFGVSATVPTDEPAGEKETTTVVFLAENSEV